MARKYRRSERERKPEPRRRREPVEEEQSAPATEPVAAPRGQPLSQEAAAFLPRLDQWQHENVTAGVDAVKVAALVAIVPAVIIVVFVALRSDWSMKVLRLPVLAWGVSFVLISVFRQTKQEEADESGE